MKIHITEDNTKQFGCIPVSCSDLVMAEMLASRHTYPLRHVHEYLNAIKDIRSGREGFFEYLFRSGAKLKVNLLNGPQFYIYCYHYSGEDGVKAVHELKVMEKMRAVVTELCKAPPDRYRSEVCIRDIIS